MNRDRVWNRVILWTALGAVGVGLGVMSYLMAESLGPRPGASMVLMGLPCMAVPTAVAAVFVLLITNVGPEGLSRLEWRLGRIVGWTTLVVCGSLVALS